MQVVPDSCSYIDALVSMTEDFKSWMKKLGIQSDVGTIQKTALLGTARIIRKVLAMRFPVSLWSFVMTRLTEVMTAIQPPEQKLK